jgi:hypothetical protein
MADLTKDAPIRVLGTLVTEKYFLDTSAAQHPYKGSPMIIDQSEDTLNVRAFVDATTVAATDVFTGIAMEEKSVALGDAETTEIECAVGPSVVGFKSTVFTIADLGKTVYMSDSGTLSGTAADNPQLGKLVAVRDGYCFVELTAPQICAGA